MLYHRAYVILLKQSDGRDPGGSGCEAGRGVRKGDPAEGQHRDTAFACQPKCLEAGGMTTRDIFLFEYGRKDREVAAVGCGLSYFFWRVTRHSDQWMSW